MKKGILGKTVSPFTVYLKMLNSSTQASSLKKLSCDSKPSTNRHRIPYTQNQRFRPKALKPILSISKTLVNKSLKLSSKNQFPAPILQTPEFPMSPSTAFSFFSSTLSVSEKKQLFQFQNIYYIRPNYIQAFSAQKSRKNYKILIGDQIAYRYQVKQQLGSGSFGQVVEAYDHKEKVSVAIKIINKPQTCIKHTGTQIKVLEALNSVNHSNIVQMKEYFIFRNHTCIVFELLVVSLQRQIQEKFNHGFSQEFIRAVSKSILEALKVSHSENIIHCDLKPENIMFTETQEVKIIDYGTACWGNQRIYSYIQSRYYRAPEVMLNLSYSFQIDIWSFGCILIEMLTGKPAFPGSSENNQMVKYAQFLGLPPDHMQKLSPRKKVFFQKTGYLKGLNQRDARKLEEIIPNASQSLVNLIKRCLVWDPCRRITAASALQHEWVSQ